MVNHLAKRIFWQWVAAWIFYTRIPLPFWDRCPLDFAGIARWLPLVGVLIGGILMLADNLLRLMAPDWVRAALEVYLWAAITGGLHLDGVADVGDGLAVSGQAGIQERLAVMADSRIGAYGALALILVLGLKGATLASLPAQQGWVLLLTPAWGRWGQLLAIGSYPYLKPQGQGRFLKESTHFPQDLWPMTLGLFLMIAGWIGLTPANWLWVSVWNLLSAIIASGVGYGWYRQLGGHTGDSYGATVEWTEAWVLVLATLHWF
ncbi:MAG: adenosylcobinamide-GDP ribazoletransferase [Cyanobacteriota bacterium]|nr:adenosylcobinamide-GDP ribazoletransferase [Cyanobacteriota bacterium]